MARTILGISPGTRAIGIVILRNGMIDLWSIHTGNAAALAAALTHIDTYNVTDIAILKSHTHTGFPRQKRLVQDIHNEARARGIPVTLYSIYALRELMPNSPNNKNTMFFHLAEIYPELSVHYQKYGRERNSYHSKIFEAVACAHALI